MGHRVRTVRRWRGALAVLVLCAAAGSASAQPAAQPRGRSQPQGGGPGAVSPAEIQRMLDGYMLIQAQEMLQLTEEQFPRFVTRVRALQQTRQRGQVERQRLLQELRRMAAGRGAAAEESAIRDRLRALDDLDARTAADTRQGQDAIDEVLTPVQQARYRLFEESMEQRKLELLMRARQANRGRVQP